MGIDLTQIILAIIAQISAVLTGFVVPLLKSKLKVEEGKITENQSAMMWLAIETAVKAAEQIYNSDEGQKKKAYVLAWLENQGYNANSALIDAAIEAMVLELHRGLDNRTEA